MDRSIGKLRKWLREEGLRDNTLLWYCGDNGTPGDGIVTSPFRGQKGNLYEGGIRVPGLIEWPARVAKPLVSDVNAVTSDILPTLCEITQTTLPKRPLDGIDLTDLIDGKMKKRSKPIGFWSFDTTGESKNKPYIDGELQRGTTPLVKLMNGISTRNFINFHHSEIKPGDFAGSRVLLGDEYKLIVRGRRGGSDKIELFHIHSDPAETVNLADSKPNIANKLQEELRAWQASVLNSLTTADYTHQSKNP